MSSRKISTRNEKARNCFWTRAAFGKGVPSGIARKHGRPSNQGGDREEKIKASRGQDSDSSRKRTCAIGRLLAVHLTSSPHRITNDRTPNKEKTHPEGRRCENGLNERKLDMGGSNNN